MKKELNNLEHLKGNNPFKVPEGYFENFTSQIMSQLPEKTYEPPKKVAKLDRIRPWLYMAAVFAGLVFFFKAVVGLGDSSENLANTDSTFVQPAIPSGTLATLQAEEDADYLEYLETQYAGYILAEEMENYE